MTCRRTVFPFTAIVGQERMKKALLLNAINPNLGGVLIRGQKGTAKSTAARALANLLPEIEVVSDCPFHCSPADPRLMCSRCTERKGRGEQLPVLKRKMLVVDLPLGATEDKVIGTLDIEHAIKKGEKRFEPGVLANANRGILYVDEVNLLDDHIVDILLDSAAMGVNIVEREGVSYSHPARFILIGTMNPEEGELRPQLLDRFGMCVEVEGVLDVEERVRIVERWSHYEEDPHAMEREWEPEDKRVRELIANACRMLPNVRYAADLVRLVAGICVDMGVDGHRADIAMLKVARTIAALHQRENVTEEDVKEAADLVLAHRMRKKPFQEPEIDRDRLDHLIENRKKQKQDDKQKENHHQHNNGQHSSENNHGADSETQLPLGDAFRVKSLTLPREREPKSAAGRRSATISDSKHGRYAKSKPSNEHPNDIALDATLRAAAPYQKTRERNGMAVKVECQDLREKVRERKIGATILFVVDSSGSMGANQRMIETKGAILSLLMDAYQKRDRVGMVAFKGDRAEVLLEPTSSVEMAKRALELLPTGGKTPMAEGLTKAWEVLSKELNKHKGIQALLVLISDGRANVSMAKEKNVFEELKQIAEQIRSAGIRSIVMDTEGGFVRFEKMRELSEALGARYFRIDDLKAENISGIVREVV